MRVLGLTLIFLGGALGAQAQEMPLWRLNNLVPAQRVPEYSGSMSPFALSAPTPVVDMQASTEEGEEVVLAKQRELALHQARMLSEPKRALQAQMLAPAKALTDGPKGLRVLVGGEWVGEGDKLPLRYIISDATRMALRELQKLDAEEAYKLAAKVETRQRELASKPSKVVAINTKDRNIRLKSDMGEFVLPLNVDEN